MIKVVWCAPCAILAWVCVGDVVDECPCWEQPVRIASVLDVAKVRLLLGKVAWCLTDWSLYLFFILFRKMKRAKYFGVALGKNCSAMSSK